MKFILRWLLRLDREPTRGLYQLVVDLDLGVRDYLRQCNPHDVAELRRAILDAAKLVAEVEARS